MLAHEPVATAILPPVTRVGVGGDSRRTRCPWALSAPEYVPYHDEEWGRPVGDDRLVFERICLEGFQSGLSWITILRKRSAFREAFCDFDPAAVAQFGEAQLKALLEDAGIVRHRGKLMATICNARATLRLQGTGRSLAGLCWSHEPDPVPAPSSPTQVPSWTAESAALAGELRSLGFRFVGPVTAYSLMQSLGLVDDHLENCSVRPLVERQRRAFRRPNRTRRLASEREA